jgi:hypothetical protein
MGIDAMGRDEGLASYLIRLLFNVLLNFTLGMDEYLHIHHFFPHQKLSKVYPI